VVLLAERGVGGGAIGSGRSCRRNWRRGWPEMGGHWKERQRKSGNTALTARSARKGRPPDGAPKKKQEYRYIGGHKKGGSDTILEMGLGPNSTQKLAQELRFTLNLINGPSP
jgi:hypothetical protein